MDDTIAVLVRNCTRTKDADGDAAASLQLAEFCEDPYNCNVVFSHIKGPLKNEQDPNGQIRMVALLQTLAFQSGNARKLLSSTDWMQRVIKVAKSSSIEVKSKIEQLIVDCYHSFSHLEGFRAAYQKLQTSQTLTCPRPSTQMPDLNSSMTARPPQPVYGVKTKPSAKISGAPRHPPMGFQGPPVHRNPTGNWHEGDLQSFLTNMDAECSNLQVWLERPDVRPNADVVDDSLKQLHMLTQQATKMLQEGDRSEMTTFSLVEAVEKANNILEFYNECGPSTFDPQMQQERGSPVKAPIPRPAAASFAPAAAAGSAAVGSAAVGSTSASGGMSGMVMAGGQVVVKSDPEDAKEIQRLKELLKQKEADERALKKENEELKMEKEALKAQLDVVAGTLDEEKKKGLPPHIVAAIKGHVRKVQMIVQSSRATFSAMLANTGETRETVDSTMGSVMEHLATIAARPDNHTMVKKLQENYLREMKLRKEFYNKIQELRGNIRVFCRVRPISRKELEEEKATEVVLFPEDPDIKDEMTIRDDEGRGRIKKFEFDRVYQPSEGQESVFQDTAPLVESVIDGYNVCIFAYGQTGSGKTYTMEGPRDNPGVNTRALKRLFQVIEERKDTDRSTVNLSILEIYNEKIRDLLVDSKTCASRNYEIKTGGEFGNYVSELSSQQVNSIEDIDKWSNIARGNRSQGKTNMNEHSSRSHMIMYFVVHTENLQTNNRCYGKLSLIDLAGSERLKKSMAEGSRAQEAVFINKSLSALGDTIASLSSGAKHVPYRNSKLTYLLQDSLGGQSKVLMFANISPASYNTTETLSTLDFATRARNTALGQAQRNVQR